jgi:hypothetical protein
MSAVPLTSVALDFNSPVSHPMFLNQFSKSSCKATHIANSSTHSTPGSWVRRGRFLARREERGKSPCGMARSILGKRGTQLLLRKDGSEEEVEGFLYPQWSTYPKRSAGCSAMSVAWGV